MNSNHEYGTYKAGDIVYVFYRNPHTQDVTNIQEAAVVNHPEQPGELALFLYETYYPLSSEMAVYATAGEAEQAYQHYFGGISEGTFQ
ncbi:transcriptional regulator of the spore photoproduct lyase operon [Fontibacillus phaseoli]|uniref:Transcriptional regulator of the spore photoproduct lyase operon n=1 Tax=Fontibacillus phaseoli TaxID=1416533 RepID=A0A369BPA1_9BACL|nr:transcriptional regulator SplA domain-containing protein [Fontibacillus phaseoli]RCX23449.1 transcriptional regulator of the spore photoproduct lyase operon [Fontibacillus phaseoli]